MTNFEFVNICGLGFVGGSIAYLCKQNDVKFSVFDVMEKNEPKAVCIYNDITSLVRESEKKNKINYYFICVPTPSKQSGECDTTIVESVVKQLSELHTKTTYILLKSTVQPGTSRKLQNKFGNNNFTVVFVPEFLTEKRANLDMYEAKFALFGTYDGEPISHFTSLFQQLYKHNSQLEFVTKKYEACEIFKYTINVFLGVKVWFFNEIYEICENFDIEYNTLRDLLPLEPRIGMSHTMVPGHDGKFSYGLACLPKEIRAFRFLQNSLGIPDKVMTEFIKRNEQELRLKPVKDN